MVNATNISYFLMLPNQRRLFLSLFFANLTADEPAPIPAEPKVSQAAWEKIYTRPGLPSSPVVVYSVPSPHSFDGKDRRNRPRWQYVVSRRLT